MIVYQTETLEQAWKELVPLVVAYWKESEPQWHYQGLNMSYARYAEYERAGMLHCVTVRDDCVMVGYALGYISDSMRSQAKMWADDMFYIAPKYRGLSIGHGLMDFVEEYCRSTGIVEIFLNGRANSSVPKMLEHVDYTLVSMQYSKRLSRADSASPPLAVLESPPNGKAQGPADP